MASEIEATIHEIAEKVAEFIRDAATMTTETWFIEIGVDEVPVEQGKADFRKNAHPLAQTVIEFEGDCIGVVPLRRIEGNKLEVDRDLLRLHEQNVAMATEYRASILNAAIGVIKERI